MNAAAGTDAPGWEPDDELIAVSAIEHYAYCARQCALIHVDQTFDENVYTVRGSQAHERIDIPGSELVSGVRYERALPIWSERLGLIGKADLVEFRPEGPFPVEYKVGRRRQRGTRFRPEDLQVCAQAMCLEEMLDVGGAARGSVLLDDAPPASRRLHQCYARRGGGRRGRDPRAAPRAASAGRTKRHPLQALLARSLVPACCRRGASAYPRHAGGALPCR